MNKKLKYLALIIFLAMFNISVFALNVDVKYEFNNRNYTFYVNATGNEATYNCSFKLYNNLNTLINSANSSVNNATEWVINVGFLNPANNNYTYLINCSNSTSYKNVSDSFEVNNSVEVHFSQKTFNLIEGKEYNYTLNDTSVFNITDKENDELVFKLAEADASLNAVLNGNILTVNPNAAGNFEAKINVSDNLTPRIWKQFVLKFNVIESFVINSINNNTQYVFETLPNQIPIQFKVIANADYNNFYCNITGDALQTVETSNATLNTIYVDVSSFRTYHYTITCWPSVNSDDVKSIDVQYDIKQVEASLSYPTEIILNEDEDKERGETARESFTIKNTGSIGLKVKLIIHNEYIEIEGENETYEFYLKPSQSKTLDIESEVRYDYDSGINDLDTIDIEYVNETMGYERKYEMKVKMFVPSLLKLDAFSVEADRTNDEVICSSYSSCFTKDKNVYEMSSSSKYVEIEPNDQIRFKVRVEVESFDMKDVYATLEVDDWDIEEESEEYDIESNEDKTFTFNINAPLRMQEDDEIEYKITVEGKDEVTRARQKITIYGKMVVTKERNKIYVDDLRLNPSEITCYDITYLTARILNIGRNDMDIKYEVKGINFDYQYSDNCDLEEYDDSDDDYCDINLAINVPKSKETEVYQISFVVKDEDNDIINGPFILNLKRNPCESEITEEENETTTEIILTNETSEIPTVYVPESKTDKETLLLLGVVGVLSVATIGMIIVLIKLLI